MAPDFIASLPLVASTTKRSNIFIASSLAEVLQIERSVSPKLPGAAAFFKPLPDDIRADLDHLKILDFQNPPQSPHGWHARLSEIDRFSETLQCCVPIESILRD